MIDMLAILFTMQGMYRAFKPTRPAKVAAYVRTWDDRHPEANKAAREA